MLYYFPMNKIKQIALLGKIFKNYKSKRTVLNSYPIRLWIEPTDFCNLECTMCLSKDVSSEKKGKMDLALFKKIINEAKDFVYDVYLHHRGEPLIQKNLIEMIKYAKGAGIKVKMHSNATLLTPDLSEQIIDSGLDLISFSFDGFDKGMYEEIRVGASFDKTVANIVEFLKIRRAKKKTKPYTVIEEIKFPEFEGKYDDAKKKKLCNKFKEAGADEIIFKELYNWGGDLQVEGLDVKEREYFRCTFLWYAMVILWDGTVTPCPQDYLGRLVLGNVKQKSIKEIWNDVLYQELRGRIMDDVGNLIPCNTCDRLFRKQVAGLPFQYLLSFLNDNLIGYGRLRKLIGSYERNE